MDEQTPAEYWSALEGAKCRKLTTLADRLEVIATGVTTGEMSQSPAFFVELMTGLSSQLKAIADAVEIDQVEAI